MMLLIFLVSPVIKQALEPIITVRFLFFHVGFFRSAGRFSLNDTALKPVSLSLKMKSNFSFEEQVFGV